jgi:8-amino-7-oxononanoate synthase
MIDYQLALEKLRDNGRLREMRPLAARKGCQVEYQDRNYLNLTSNDYLGFAGDEALHNRFYQERPSAGFLDTYGLGAASSRLLTGDNHLSHQLEQCLCGAYQKEGCLLFNSGYHANIGILPALLTKGDLILSDKLNHASIMDGMRLCTAEHKRYRHRDYAGLRRLLTECRREYGRVIIVSESVFSMDGDVADLRQLVELKNEFDCLLYVDEAHGIGLYGENGLGMAEAQGVVAEIDLLLGTFGKALSSVGAFLLCTDTIRKFLINTSRSLIFTTALPPVVVHWNLYLFKEVAKCGEKRRQLAALAEQLREDLRAHDLKTDGETNIIPVMIGEDGLAVALAEKMQAQGYLIFPVRPPTVPEKTARFRLSLTANMCWQDLAGLAKSISQNMKNLQGKPATGKD